MAQQQVALNSQLLTGKVPIPRFPKGEVSAATWIAISPQLNAAMVSQGCDEAWNKTPNVANAERHNHQDNTVDDDAREQLAKCNSAVAVCTASFALNK